MAAQTTATSENKKKIWSVNFRPKVGQSVSYLGNQWLSISGINSEPTLSNDDDWILVKESNNESNNNEFLKLTDALTTVTNTNKLITDEDYKGLIFISQWNATTNTPTLTNSNPSKFREAYINLSASTRFGIAWEKGDYLVYDFDGNIFKEDNPLLNIVSKVGFSNDYDDLDNLPTIKRTKKPISTATYTFEASDANKYIEFSAECVATVPDGLPADLEFQGIQAGSGQVTFTTAPPFSGTNDLNVFAGFLKETAGQHCFWGIRTEGSNRASLTGTLKLA
jgi:hypothetical protein